jgi:hypothetical protein
LQAITIFCWQLLDAAGIEGIYLPAFSRETCCAATRFGNENRCDSTGFDEITAEGSRHAQQADEDERTPVAATQAPMTLAQAAESPDPRDLLRAMRDKLAAVITDPQNAAAATAGASQV